MCVTWIKLCIGEVSLHSMIIFVIMLQLLLTRKGEREKKKSTKESFHRRLTIAKPPIASPILPFPLSFCLFFIPPYRTNRGVRWPNDNPRSPSDEEDHRMVVSSARKTDNGLRFLWVLVYILSIHNTEAKTGNNGWLLLLLLLYKTYLQDINA